MVVRFWNGSKGKLRWLRLGSSIFDTNGKSSRNGIYWVLPNRALECFSHKFRSYICKTESG